MPLCPYLNKLYTFIINTLVNFTSISDSGDVSTPIKLEFLIKPESIQTILKYVRRLCINNTIRKTIPNCNNSNTKKMLT